MNTKKYINPPNLPPILGTYSQGVSVNIGTAELIFITGQMAMDGDGNPVAPNDIRKQTECIFQNIGKILEESGMSFDDIVKTTIYVTDISQFKDISPIRNIYLKDAKAASTLIQISKTIKQGCDIEVEAIAIK